MSAPFDYLLPDNEDHLLARLDRLERDQEIGMPATGVDAAWLLHICGKLLAARIAARREVADLRLRLAELEQGQTVMPLDVKPEN